MMRAYKIIAFMLALCFAAVSLAHAGGHRGRMALEGPRTERWLAGLPPEQQQKARVILEEERPGIQDLHYRIHCKMQELEGLKKRAAEYLDENGVMIGFVNNLLGL